MRPALLLLLVMAPVAGAQTPAVRPVGLADVRWTDGFWAERFRVCRAFMVPAMGDLMFGTERSHFLQNFRIAAGLAEGKHRGPPWNDGDFYKWIEAASAVLAVAPDPALDRRLVDAIAIIAKAQRADGYLHTPVLIARRNGDAGAKPFADRLNFEMYNFGHLFTAACVHHRTTGNRTLLDVATKAADFLAVAFEKPSAELARNSVCPSHYMGIVELYRETRKPQYLALAKKWIELRDLMADGTDDNQDRLPFRRQTEAAGHAVRANYLYAGVADLLLESPDTTLAAPLEAIWKNVTSRKVYVTGACGALFDGASPDGIKDQKAIARVHQAYGRDFQLPNATAHNETCAAVGNVLWNDRMLRLTGDPKHADMLERALLNAVLAGVSLDGTSYFYTNTLRQLDAMPVPLRWSRRREPWISCFCCPPNVVRTIAQSGHYAYGRSDSAIWFHTYGGSTLKTDLPDGGRAALAQRTDYPWDGRVTVAVEAMPARAVELRFRIPPWAHGATLAVNGEAQSNVATGRYASVKRTWKTGDIIELTLPMRAALLQSHPLVEETRNQVAVRRGPMIYCLESSDLPADHRAMDVRIPADFAPASRYDPKLLGGVAVLEGRATFESEAEWGNELYREYRPAKALEASVRLVPYFAWGNRGPSEMSVWLPLKP